MDKVNDVIASIYNILLQLRYPHISNVELKDMETTILSGENRLYLLSWLLTEKSSSAAAQLGTLKDTALEGIFVFLVTYYHNVLHLFNS